MALWHQMMKKSTIRHCVVYPKPHGEKDSVVQMTPMKHNYIFLEINVNGLMRFLHFRFARFDSCS